MKADKFLLDVRSELGGGQPFGGHVLQKGHGDLAVGPHDEVQGQFLVVPNRDPELILGPQAIGRIGL